MRYLKITEFQLYNFYVFINLSFYLRSINFFVEARKNYPLTKMFYVIFRNKLLLVCTSMTCDCVLISPVSSKLFSLTDVSSFVVPFRFFTHSAYDHMPVIWRKIWLSRYSDSFPITHLMKYKTINTSPFYNSNRCLSIWM